MSENCFIYIFFHYVGHFECSSIKLEGWFMLIEGFTLFSPDEGEIAYKVGLEKG